MSFEPRLLTFVIASCAITFSTPARADAPPLEPRRDTSLTRTATVATSTAARDPLEADLERQLGAMRGAEKSAPGTPSNDGAGSGNASSRGLSTAFNPAISANGIVNGGLRSREDGVDDARADLRSGVHLQEVELQASAIVDPYFRADVVLSASEDEIGVEEAYVSTLELPRVTLRAGQMKAAFGRHNPLHTHAYPFITAPLPWRALLGPEGLADPGVSAELLLPLPFFAELTGQVFRGTWAPLGGPNDRIARDLGVVGRLRTLFDLSDSATVELGGSYAGGANGFGGFTHIAGGDLTVKWRPVERERDRGLDWTTEYLYVNKGDAPDDEAQVGGAYSSLRAQLAQRWWVQARGAVLGLPQHENQATWRGEGLVAFVPSEFSLLRLQYAYQTKKGEDPLHEVFMQLVFSIGSHPAHSY